MKILLLINILLSTAIARCASYSSRVAPLDSQVTPTVYGANHPLKIATVSTLSGETTIIGMDEKMKLGDLKREARGRLKPVSFYPSQLVCGTKVINTDEDLQAILNGTEEPYFTLMMEQPKAHSDQEIDEFLDLKECEDLVSFMARKTVRQDNEDGTFTETEVSVPWNHYGRDLHFAVYFVYGHIIYPVFTYEPFTPKRYAFMGPCVKVDFNQEFHCDIYAQIRFETKDWNFEGPEPRFEAEPVGIVFPRCTVPKPLSKAYYDKLCKNAIDRTKALQIHDDALQLFDASLEAIDRQYLSLKPTEADYQENLLVRAAACLFQR